jgi:hypothetical protein
MVETSSMTAGNGARIQGVRVCWEKKWGKKYKYVMSIVKLK